MAQYCSKCPKCGSELEEQVTWDIVTDQYCSSEKCDWSKHYGSAQFYDGKARLVSDFMSDYYLQ